MQTIRAQNLSDKQAKTENDKTIIWKEKNLVNLFWENKILTSAKQL
jgi:hypothetical protein